MKSHWTGSSVRRAPGLALAFVLCVAGGLSQAQVPIRYVLSQTGMVSMAVYDGKGCLIRTLLSGDRETAGRHRVEWDGLDWTGKPVPPGEYEWRLLESQGLRSEFLMRIGTSFNYQDWPCNHGGPAGVAILDGVAVMAGSGECTPSMAAVDLRSGEYLRQSAPWIGDVAAASNRLFFFGGRDGSAAGTLTVRAFDDWSKVMGTRDLTLRVRRFVAAASTNAVQADAIPITLDVYDAGRGYGWDRTNGLALAEWAAGAQRMAGFVPEPGKADTNTLRTFMIDVPEGRYTVELDLGTGTNKVEMQIFSGLKDGTPALVKTESIEERKTLRVESRTVGGRLLLGFNNKAGQRRSWCLRGVRVVDIPARIAACGSRLVVGYTGSGRVEWLSQNDDLQALGTATVSNLTDLAVTADGNVMALSGNEVVEVPYLKPAGVARIGDLHQPRRIAVDPSNGDILVVDDGGNGQIKRYARNFQLARTYGRAGGRQQGLYEPGDFCAVTDIAADGAGGFAIVENWSAPRRLAHFDGDGKVINEWYGGQLFFTLGVADPAQPERVWMNSHWGWVMETEADYSKRTWKPRATYVVNGLGDGLFKCSSLGLCGAMRRRGDERYIVQTDLPRILLVDEGHRRLRPLVAFAFDGSASPTLNAFLKEANEGKPPKEKFQSFLWQDANADGVPQKDEVSFATFGQWRFRWSMDADFNYYLSEMVGKGTRTNVIRKLPVLRWEGARPVYPLIGDAAIVAQLVVPAEARRPGRDWGGPFEVESDGAVYEIAKGRGEGFTADYQRTGHTGLWPNSLSGDAGVCKWSMADGSLQWRVGKLSATERQFIPGQLDDPIGFFGRYKDLILMANRIVMPLVAWTEDGMFAGSLFDRHAADGLPEATYTWWMGKGKEGDKEINSPLQYDMFVGGSFLPLTNGEALFFGAGWNHVPVYRVTGWDGFTRQTGKVRVKKAARAASETGTGLAGAYFANDKLAGSPVARRTDTLLWFGNDDTGTKKAWAETNLCAGAFSARWTGYLEPRFTEPYTLKAYVGSGRPAGKQGGTAPMPPDRVRVWLDGKLVIDGWDPKPKDSTHLLAKPVLLEAGRKVAIQVEYAKTVTGNLHLCWESLSQEIEHVPTACLYPGTLPQAKGASMVKDAVRSDQVAKVVFDPGPEYQVSARLWQGIPGIERAANGRLWAAWYTGGKGEGLANHVVLATSGDEGRTWVDPVLVVLPPEASRVFDPCLWCDPLGRLWVFWAQSAGKWYDGRAGVWAIRADDATGPRPKFTEPRRLTNGIMMNKPLVLSTGEWAMPSCLWARDHAACEPALVGERFSNIVVSRDAGETWHWRGGADVPKRDCDEHMMIERRDGSLWMLVRTLYGIGESISRDGGMTWSPGEPSALRGPCSRFFIRRLASGRLLLINHDVPPKPVDPKLRNRLTAFLSDDDGQTWPARLLLDERDWVSYPDATEDGEGRIYAIYDRGRGDHPQRGNAREILMATFTEADIRAGRLVDARSRLRVIVSKPPVSAP